ncbi:SOD2 [[Candida] subhashii]|uniref:Superoxide dismutase n=1 Tax=[Candida] subhashii TaxID=561895 RepID=A0A8J5UVR3_9ASCO|nr:SOD2 [[Candida] subhashii]KAG7662405.1 SOD2 [[Candida] subhashii]
MLSLKSSTRTLFKSTSVAASSIGAIRTNVTKLALPDLEYDYGALEPHISAKINEIHHTKHHQAYTQNYNIAVEQAAEASVKGEAKKLIELQKAINFNAGGYVNHCLFWKNLSPEKQFGGQPPAEDSEFAKKIIEQYGSLENLKTLTNSKLAGIQGSGWAFIVKNKDNGGALDVVTTSNQDTVTGPLVPLVAIDAWEHAYYLQYQNVKADYFKAIWNVINWKEAEKRYLIN